MSGFLKRKKRKTGIALGSGAAKGLSHVGVLRVFQENGVEFDYVCGTSIGALIGAVYCSSFPMREFEELLVSLDKKQIISLFMPTPSRLGLISGYNIEKFLFYFLGNKTFGDLDIPLAVVAADIFSGEEVVLSRGNLIKAVRASISIPGVFIPVTIDERRLVDGSIINPIPVSVLKSIDRDILSIGVKVNSKVKNFDRKIIINRKRGSGSSASPSEVKNKIDNFLSSIKEENSAGEQAEKDNINIFDVVLNSIYIMENNIADMRLRQDKPDCVICPDVSDVPPMGYFRMKDIIERGKDAATEALPEIKSMIGS
ncbi:MAG: patatin-like phospholipase family protein [bacterium]|nr:patatin-like phospholipase family protein [bacterium]